MSARCYDNRPWPCAQRRVTIAPAYYDLAGMAGGLGPLGAVELRAKRRGV